MFSWYCYGIIFCIRNFSFIRFGILFCAFNYFFYYKTIFNKVFIIWLFLFFLIIIDVYVESFTGTNILGYGEAYPRRIVSFFKDELIVGGFVNAFYLILAGYCFSLNSKFSKNYKYFILAGSLFFFVAILLTVERSNTIKALAEEEYWIATQNTKKETDVKIRLKATSDRLTETKNNLKNEPTSNLSKRISIDNSTILGFSLISLVSTILAVLYVSCAEIQNTFSQENVFLADYRLMSSLFTICKSFFSRFTDPCRYYYNYSSIINVL